MSGARGAVTTELAVLTPALVVLMVFVVFTGRAGQAAQDVTQAAAEAARVASLVRRTEIAPTAAATAERNLAAAGVRCRRLDVAVDTTDHRPGGAVRVDVRCEVDMTGVAGLGLPRRTVVSAAAVEVVDTYRGGGHAAR